jgi:hypothetical protein
MTPPDSAAAIDELHQQRQRHHLALHLAHRWFAFFEAQGGDLDAHLALFHPQVRLSGRGGSHVFAREHASLRAWFAAVPDAASSHHIVHSDYATAEGGDGLLKMVVAYQAPAGDAMHGAIISYATRIEFAPDGARFVALDKTPVLGNTRLNYETSWATNRVLARVHAGLGGIADPDRQLRAALGEGARQVSAQVVAAEGSPAYQALVTSIGGDPAGVRAVRLDLTDDVRAAMPVIVRIVPYGPA